MNDMDFWLKQSTIDVLAAAYLLAGEPLPRELRHSVNDMDYPPKVTAMIRLIRQRTGAVVRVSSTERRRLRSNLGGTAPRTQIDSTEFCQLLETQSLCDQSTLRATRWPWGEHETKLLRQLAAAAEEFWKLYDPADPSTAPTNAQVSGWLVRRGVPERSAGAIATILRADGLPSGPRK